MDATIRRVSIDTLSIACEKKHATYVTRKTNSRVTLSLLRIVSIKTLRYTRIFSPINLLLIIIPSPLAKRKHTHTQSNQPNHYQVDFTNGTSEKISFLSFFKQALVLFLFTRFENDRKGSSRFREGREKGGENDRRGGRFSRQRGGGQEKNIEGSVPRK